MAQPILTNEEIDRRARQVVERARPGHSSEVRKRFDPSIVRDVERVEKPDERDWWRARNERDCRGCGRRFMPNARADRYCDTCKAARNGDGPEATATVTTLTPRPANVQARLLRRLNGSPALQFVHDLANCVGVSRDEARRALDGLSDRGFLREMPGPPGRFELTASGRRAIDRRRAERRAA